MKRVREARGAFTRIAPLTLAVIAMVNTAPAALAQSPEGEESAKLDAVQVTGSRIRSFTADSPSPIQVVTSEDIERSGVTNIQELLLKIPSMGTADLGRTNSNFLTSSSGVATVDLRDLGADRTLVLVNGRRFVSGIPGSAAVDLNTIPTDFIERVEIFTGGASSIYGSDAMAGVVNIVLKRNFQGFTVDVQQGESAEGDDRKEKISVTGGINSADGRSNLMAHFAYSRQGAVFGKDRKGAEIDNLPLAFLTGDANDLFTFEAPFLSSFSPAGRFFFEGGSRTFDADGNLIAVDTNGDNGPATGFNRQDFRYIAVPTERHLFATSGTLAIADNHNAFFEGTFSQTQIRSLIEPFPLDSADANNGIYPATQVGPAEFNVNGQILANPLIPDDLLALFTDTDGDGLRDYSFTRRLSEVGNRGSTADRDTFRIVAGFNGTFLDDWSYEAYAAYGTTKESQVSGGQVNVVNFRNALEAIPDVDDVNGNGDTQEAICRDATARAQGCVPANVFGPGLLTGDALRYIIAPSLLITAVEQRLFGGVVSGTPFILPAGPVGLAVGVERREEFSRSEFDPLQQAGLNGGNAIPRTEGEFDVTEGFAEVKVPLIQGVPFADLLMLSGAIRSSDYSTVGSVFSYTVGLEWAPTTDVRVRATQARSTRAPNIGELFSPPSQTFPSVTDPCEGVTATGTGELAERCRAEPGVLANINANDGVFTINQADIQGVSGFDRGNPNAEEEVGDSWTFGVVWTPNNIEILKNFSFEVDYYNIEIEDALVSTPRQFILDQCYGGGDASFCQFVTRRDTAEGANSAGSLRQVDSAVSNSGGLEAKGFDVTANWSDMVGPGRLTSRLIYTRLQDGLVIPLPGAAADPYAGEVGSAKDKFALQLGYGVKNWTVSALTTYIGKSDIDDQFLAAFGAAPGSFGVPAKTYVDVQAGYSFPMARVYIGIDNLFDTSAPRFDTNGLIPGGTTGTGTAADVYDAIGQRYYAGVKFSF